MAYKEHSVVKPREIVDAGVAALSMNAVASNLVTREGFEKFAGREGDTVSVRVKGPLPVRQYGWRNDREEPIITDTIKDTIVDLKVDPSRNYSAVKLTDEEKLFDWNGGWGDIFARQTEALANYNEAHILNKIVSAPYEREIVIDSTAAAIKAEAEKNRDNLFNAFVEAKRDLKKMRSPGTDYVALVGSALAAEIQKSQKLVTATGGGDTALSTATVGGLAGVTVVESPNVPDFEGYVFSKSAFVFYNAAPPVPTSAPFAAAAASGGFALRWVMDYDTSFATDRSLFDTFVGYNYTKDIIVLQDANGRTHNSEEMFFTRGVKLILKTDDENKTAKDVRPGDGTRSDLAGNKADSWLALAYQGKLAEAVEAKGQAFPGVLEVPGVMPTGEAPGTGSSGD